MKKEKQRKLLGKERKQWGNRENTTKSSREDSESVRRNQAAHREGVDATKGRYGRFSSQLESVTEKGENKSMRTDDARRSEVDTVSASNLTKEETSQFDESYQEVLDELEEVTEQLITTQQKLWKTEDKLRDAEADAEERQDRRESNNANEQVLRSQVAALEEDLAAAQEELRMANERQNEVQTKQNMRDFDLQTELQNQLDQAKEENALLLEEVAALREQHQAMEPPAEEMSVMMEPFGKRGFEPSAFRGQMDDLIEQNGILQQRVVELEGRNYSEIGEKNDEIFDLREQIERLQYELSAATDQHRIALLENDSAWREKLERIRESSKHDFMALKMSTDSKVGIVEGLQQQIRDLCRERDELETKITNFENNKTETEMEESEDRTNNAKLREQVQAAQCTNSKLQQRIDELTATIEYSSTVIEKLESERAEVATEVESARPLIDNLEDGCGSPASKGNNTFADIIRKLCLYAKSAESKETDVSKLRETISQLELDLECSRDNVQQLSKRLETRQGEQEEGARRKLEIDFLHKELNSCRSALEAAERDNKKLRDDVLEAKTKQAGNDRKASSDGDSQRGHWPLRKQSHNPRAMDPEPDNVRVDEAKNELKTNPNPMPLLPPAYHRKDPPPSEQKRRKNDLLSFVDSKADIHTLWHHLEHMALENKALEEKLQEVQRGDKNGSEDAPKKCLLELQGQIKALQDSHSDLQLKKEVENSKIMLQAKTNELEISEKAARDSKIKYDTLQGELSHLSEAIATEKESKERIKQELEATIRKVAEEKSNLQSSLDDTKELLAAALKEGNQKIEKSLLCEKQLIEAQGEVRDLQKEIKDLNSMLSEVRKDYDLALYHSEDREKKNRSEISSFSNQLKKLADDNNALHRDNEDKSQEIHLLSRKVSDLSSELEIARGKYDGAVDDLEAVSRLFEEARREAERCGREGAAEELRAKMMTHKENERNEIHERLENVFNENRKLQAQLAEATRSSSITLTRQTEKVGELETKTEHLQQALDSSTNEIKRMKKREVELKKDLDKAKDEARHKTDELKIASSSIEHLQKNLEEQQKCFTANKASAPTAGHKILLDHMRGIISRLGGENEPQCTRKANELQLKVELLDISASMDKIMRENAALEEEMRNSKTALNETRRLAEMKGRKEATKEVWDEIKESREKEMDDFKEQFIALVQENSEVEKKWRESTASLKRSRDALSRAEADLLQAQKEADSSKFESKKLEQEIVELHLKMEAVKDEMERAVEEAKSAGIKDGEAKALQEEIYNLTVENSALRHNLRRAKKDESATSEELRTLRSSLNKACHTIEEIKEERDRLSAKVETTESESEEVGELRNKLQYAEDDLAEMGSKVLTLGSALDEQTKELQHLQRKYAQESNLWKANESHATKKLQEEKSLLQKQLDEAQFALSVAKREQEKLKREQEKLKQGTLELQALKVVSESRYAGLKRFEEDLAIAKEENANTMKALSVINKLLDSIEGVEFHSTTGILTIPSKVAEGIRKKVERVVLHLKKSNGNDRVSEMQLKQKSAELQKLQMQLQLSNAKCGRARKEASHWQGKVTDLLEELANAKNEHAALQTEMKSLNSRFEEMCREAEERGKQKASKEIQDACNEALPRWKNNSSGRTLAESENDGIPKEIVHTTRKMLLELGRSRPTPEPRNTQDSDILSQIPSRDSDDMEESVHISDLQAEIRMLQKQFERLPEHSKMMESIFGSQERIDEKPSDIKRR
eukprot:scaffold982_cov139-Cylindrotheca_fusiformis.AAC.18